MSENNQNSPDNLVRAVEGSIPGPTDCRSIMAQNFSFSLSSICQQYASSEKQPHRTSLQQAVTASVIIVATSEY